MNDYRPLTLEEIEALRQNDCWAEDWTSVNVAEDFQPEFMHHVMMYGEVNIGSFNKQIEVSAGFAKHTGIRNATLNNVTIGDDCLIENIGNFINNYTIGDDCYISNVGTIETTEGATYGEGNPISVLNEGGNPNILIFSNLTSQLAALMLRNQQDREFLSIIFKFIQEGIQSIKPERGLISNNVMITNTREITNCIIDEYCDIEGADTLCDCTLAGDALNYTRISAGVIAEGTIFDYGATVLNGANLHDCFVGEQCIINHFTASSSLFFANSVMSNGEACAAFCGPFSSSHHKSSLLIGCQTSFYNAGSATNFSNHAYKMGPIHWGTLERGTKTASGAYLFMPATIGAYSVCLGKIMNHPDSTLFPFSYLFGEGDKTILIPGKNLVTAGLFRDVKKWPQRDLRPQEHRKSLVNFEWLSPYTIGKIIDGKNILQKLMGVNGKECQEYHYQGLTIPRKALQDGIAYYDLAIKMFFYNVFSMTPAELCCDDEYKPFESEDGTGQDWIDLCGLLMTEDSEYYIIQGLKEKRIKSLQELNDEFDNIFYTYRDLAYPHIYNMVLTVYDTDEISQSLIETILQEGKEAKKTWLELIEKDAKKEFALGDVEESTYNNFVSQVWQSFDKEDTGKDTGDTTDSSVPAKI